MANDLNQFMDELGLPMTAIDEVVDGFDEDVADLLGNGGDVGAFIQKKAPNLPIAQQNALASGLISLTNDVHRAYATAAAVYAHNSANRPNAAVTLFARDVGLPCVGGTIYALRPRTAGVLATDNFWFDSDMVLERLIVNPSDIQQKFVLVGASTGYDTDKMYSFRYDTSIIIGSTELRVEETPWASIMKRRPKERVAFTAKVYFDEASSESMIFGGLTLSYNEKSCGAFMRLWRAAEDGIGFNELSQLIMQRASTRVRPRRIPGGRSIVPNRNSALR